MSVENLTSYFNARSINILDLTAQARAIPASDLVGEQRKAYVAALNEFIVPNQDRLTEIGFLTRDAAGKATTDITAISSLDASNPIRQQYEELVSRFPTIVASNALRIDLKRYSDLNLDSGAWIERNDRVGNYFLRTTEDRTSHLPQEVQDFVASVKNLPPQEKMQEIKLFIDERMKYTTDAELHGDGSEYYATLEETIASGWRGDCDDYAEAYSELARLSGIDPQNVQSLAGYYTYTIDNKSPGTTGGHIAAMIRDGDSWFMLDMNSANVQKMNRDFSYQTENGAVTVQPTAIYDHDSFYWSVERERKAETAEPTSSALQPVQPRDIPSPAPAQP